jgi:hypothetical protein
MKTEKIWEYRLSNGRKLFAFFDSKKWFIECYKNELPDEVINSINELDKKSKILKRLIS